MTTDTRDRRVLPAVVAFVVAAFLVVPMVMSAATVNAQSQESEDPCDGVPRSTFEDRNEADVVHRRSIDCVDHYEISSGDATGRFFRPDRLVDRAQMATFIVQTLEAAGLSDRLPSGGGDDEFSDISDSVHRENINILARIGVVQGNNGRYSPDVDIKRDQMATFLLQAKEWAFQEEYAPANSYFGDVRPTNAHFDNINAAYEEFLLNGTKAPRDAGTDAREDDVPNSGEYSPGQNVRRQNMASFLSNELHQVWDAPEQFCAASTPSPTSSASARPTPTGSASATPTPTSSSTPSPGATASPTPTASPTGTASASAVLPLTAQQQTTSPSPSGSPCATRSGSPSPSPSSTASPRPSASPSATASPEDCDLPVDPTGIICPEPEPSASASATPSPTTSASPTSGSGAVLPLDL